MTYDETIQYLYDSVPMFQQVGSAAYKEGLYNTLLLDERFGHPHKSYKTIHIAGTNGKGSCSHLTAAILQAAGYKTGLYTSPHLVDFRERIRVNGQPISRDYVVEFVARERSFFEPLRPSFFELTTAMAFKFFADCGVDVAVIEVGLGGRLDCTNIITPLLSVITNISLDHTQFLGNTRAAIAKEKAGIIKRNIPVVIGEADDETRPVFAGKAKEMHAPIVFAEDEMQVNSYRPAENEGIDYDTKDIGLLHGELGGLYQVKNTNTVLCAVNQLLLCDVLNISADDVRKGFASVVESTGLLGRWQQLRSTPTVICDTGHNTGGWKYLNEQLKRQHCRQLRVVFGMVDDKDIDTVAHMLPTDAVYYFTQASTRRALGEHRIMAAAASANLKGQWFTDVPTAYAKAINDSSSDDLIFVGGSSYIVADLLAHLRKQQDQLAQTR